MVDNMVIEPLQTSSRKCAFGHFYNAFQITDPKLTDTWQGIAVEHKKFHELGKGVIEAIKQGDSDKAYNICSEAEQMSHTLMAQLDEIKTIAEEMGANGEHIS